MKRLTKLGFGILHLCENRYSFSLVDDVNLANHFSLLFQQPLVTTWASTQRLVLAQVKVEDHSHEITALPALSNPFPFTTFWLHSSICLAFNLLVTCEDNQPLGKR